MEASVSGACGDDKPYTTTPHHYTISFRKGPIGRDGVVVDYSARKTDACWQAFNAALDCVVIELPEYTEEVRQYGYAAADVHSAIESTNLGIKVK